MEILFVRNLFRPADFGGNRYPWEVTKRLATRHSVRVITPRPSGTLPGPTGAKLHHYPASRRTPFETFFTNALCARVAVEQQIRAHRPDVIILSSYDVAFGHFLIARPPIPTIYIYHSSFYSPAVDRVAQKPWPFRLAHRPLTAFERRVELIVFRSADAIVAVSPFSKAEIEHRLGRTEAKIRIIPTGVDTEFFRPGNRNEARGRLGLSIDARVVVTAGRFAPVKRYDRAIDALAILRQRDPRYVLVMAGSGPEEEELRRHAAQTGAGAAIRFAGFRDGEELRDLYWAADIVLCTSDFENWSLALLEAMASGTPVIGTPRGSIPDLIGIVDPSLVAAGVSPAELASKVREVFDDRDRLTRLGKLARTRVSAQFTWERTVDALDETLQMLATYSSRR